MGIEMNDLVKARTGEPLEEKLKKDADFLKRQREWRDAIHKFDKMVSMTHEQWLALEHVEDIFLEYNISYGEAAYKMGYSDGIEIGMEQTPDGRKSVLTVEDMANLISVYDAIQQLKKVLLGRMDEHWEEAGAFSVFEHIFDVINNATCTKIKFSEGNEAIEMVTDILDDEMMKPEEKAKRLLGVE